MEVYSPELVSAQQEFLIANAGQQSLAGGSAAAQRGSPPSPILPLSGYAIGISGKHSLNGCVVLAR